jgi:hypothetical protein
MMQVNVQMLSGPLPPIDVPVDATVRDLKHHVQQSIDSNLKFHLQKMFIRDRQYEELLNGRTLESYDISSDTIIMLVIADHRHCRLAKNGEKTLFSPHHPFHINWLINEPVGQVTVRTDDICGNEDILFNLIQVNLSIHTLEIDGHWLEAHLLFCKNLMALRAGINIKYIFKDFSPIVIKTLEFYKTCVDGGHSKIQLTFCDLSAETDSTALSLALQSMTSLRKLSLPCNRIVESGFIDLAPALKSMSALQILNLSQNNIGDAEGCIALAAALSSMPALASVNLSANKLKGTGCAMLVTALAQISTLQDLYLSSNDIGDVGCVVLATALELMISIEVLGLSHNQITNKGLADLETTLVLLSHASLETLSLEGNDLSVSHCRRVLQSIPHLELRSN